MSILPVATNIIPVFDSFKHVLGDFAELNSIVKAQYPTIKLVDSTGNVVDENHPKTAPDHILVQGTLVSDALASISFRTVSTTSDGVSVSWLISGTEGELEVIMPESMWQVGHPRTTFKVNRGTGGVEDVDLGVAKGVDPDVPFIGKNTARLYEAFAKKEKEKYADFEDGLATHQALDRILQASK
jgi:predicted dehydrogenase